MKGNWNGGAYLLHKCGEYSREHEDAEDYVLETLLTAVGHPERESNKAFNSKSVDDAQPGSAQPTVQT